MSEDDSYKIVRASIKLETAEEEPIAPVEIRHDVDEVRSGGVTEQRYNFIDYHFEKYGAYCRARVYLDEPESATHYGPSVAFYGPFESRGSETEVEAPELEQEVLGYLQRRFSVIEILGEEGYVELWRHPDSDRET